MDEMNGGAVYGLTLKLYDMESMWYQLWTPEAVQSSVKITSDG
jgi:hypothetical protein